MPILDLTNQRFGNLTVEKFLREYEKGTGYWLCQCTCGKEKAVQQSNLVAGHVRSCGCLRRRCGDLIGQRFGRLTVVENAGKDSNGRRLFLCQCDCGNSKTLRGSRLITGATRSCSCLVADTTTARLKTHGMRNSPIYRIWAGMIQRCINPNTQSHKNYGGRGIQVCDRWRNSFEAFFADMGPRPGKEWSIERNDVNGNYEPGNCQWISSDLQGRNRRDNVLLSLGEQFDRLTIIEGPIWTLKGAHYRVKCKCGQERIVAGHRLRAGLQASCGCFSRLNIRIARIAKTQKKLQAMMDAAGGKLELTGG